MKKIFLIILFLSSILPSQAQDAHFGLKAGMNVSNLRYENQSASPYKLGYHVGGLAHIHVSPDFAFQPELIFSNQGGKQKIGGNEYNLNLNYVSIPLLFQYMFGDGFRLQAGPQLSLLVNAKRQLNDDKTNIKSNYKSADISLPLGFSYVTENGLGVDARWVIGLNNINSDDNGTPIRNSMGQVGIFYLLNYHEARNRH